METYFENISAKEGSGRKLVQDLGILVRDAEALLGSVVGGMADKSRGDVRARLVHLKASVQRLEGHAVAGARQADAFVRERPAQAVGIAFAVGVLLGFCRRR